ncbi:MAG: DUF4215 domain-containing protein [Planctomycetes bacterium]|nr:DUF4215 domain-containing protein [Planctomycetota bacterium]
MSTFSRRQVMQVRIGVMLGLSWVLGFTSINAVGQETFSGCGVMFLGPDKCLTFIEGQCSFPYGNFTFALELANVGGFGHLDCVYVTGTVEEGCISICGGGRCTRDNTIEPCPVCGDGVVASTEECDDQDLDDGDGCSSICAVEEGFFCNGEPSVCNGIPAMSTWGAVILTLLLLSAGTICLRRRRQPNRGLEQALVLDRCRSVDDRCKVRRFAV